jgi:hypothetical protein
VRFRDDFDGHDLDRSVWTPHYLPQWSARALSAATYEVAGSELRLSIPPEQGLWCPEEHDEPLRVSGIQSGVCSGAVGSTAGQQPFRDPALREDFTTARLPIDVTAFHVYAVDWRPGRVDFLVDGEHVRTVAQAPDYTMQLMVGVFDFPAKPSAAAHAHHVPRLVLDSVGER